MDSLLFLIHSVHYHIVTTEPQNVTETLAFNTQRNPPLYLT